MAAREDLNQLYIGASVNKAKLAIAAELGGITPSGYPEVSSVGMYGIHRPFATSLKWDKNPDNQQSDTLEAWMLTQVDREV